MQTPPANPHNLNKKTTQRKATLKTINTPPANIQHLASLHHLQQFNKKPCYKGNSHLRAEALEHGGLIRMSHTRAPLDLLDGLPSIASRGQNSP